MSPRCLAALALASVLGGQTGPNVQQPAFKSDLLDNLAGLWTLSTAPGSRPARGGADAVWELGHQWLRYHQKEIDGPEFVMYIGFDTYDKRLVAIRLDSISARGAETNGYGFEDGNKLSFTFDYPTVQFRQSWTWDPTAKTWQFSVESKQRRAAGWTPVSSVTLHRFGGGRRGPGGSEGGPDGPRGRGFTPPPPQ